MSMFEQKLLGELRKLREEEAALAGLYATLETAGGEKRRSFAALLRTLDDRVSRFETLLERGA